MSFFNEEAYVHAAIESVLAQTYEEFELIIIDDYSTDNSLEICKGFADPRIRIYCKTSEPRYLAASRNIAIRMAKGEYLINQDADDWSHPTRVETQLNKALENPGRRVVGCSANLVENGLNHIVLLPEKHEEICAGFHRFYNRATIFSQTILAPKRIFEEIPYRVRFKYMQDWDHTLRMYESGKVEFYNCQEPLYTYYIRPKCVVFAPEWLDCNIFVRHCQMRRRKELEEFKSVDDFREYLATHPVAGLRWHGLKKLIELRLRIRQKR